MILFDMVTQTWWRQYHMAAGWFVDSISEESAVRLIKEGWPLRVDDIQAVNAASVESYIKYRL